jgi:hypothetical protein
MNLSVGTLSECKTLFDEYRILFIKNKVVDWQNKVADSQNKVVDWIALIKVDASNKVLHRTR